MPTMNATDQLAAEMTRHGISIEIDGPEYREKGSGDAWQSPHYAYSFMLDVKGERLISNGFYGTGTGHAPGSATPADVFGSILSDCSSVEPYANTDEEEERNVYPQTRSEWPPNWDEWADDLGFFADGHPGRGQLRRIAGDFRDIMSRRALLRDRLGVETYDALLEIAAEL